VNLAKEKVGSPYKHMGRDWDTGVDCAGVLVCIARDLELQNFESIIYATNPEAHSFKKEIIRFGATPVPVTDAADGDIVRLLVSHVPVHCGILEKDSMGQWWMIHAWQPVKKVERSPMTPAKWNMVADVWRFPGG
jgi:hypothetical protein